VRATLVQRASVIARARKEGGAMKLLFGVLVFIWVLCGAVGAWWIEDLDAAHWKVVARGPFALAAAFNDQPVTYPGP
jgi:hypothetical protein